MTFDEDITKALASGPIIVDSKEDGGLLLNLKIKDEQGIMISTILLERNNPSFGLMTYRLLKKKANGSKRLWRQKNIILRSNPDFNGQIHLNDLEVGDYELILDMDANRTLNSPLAVRVISSSQTLSMNQQYLALKKATRAIEVFDDDQLQQTSSIKSFTSARRVDISTLQPTEERVLLSGARVAVVVEPRNVHNALFNYTSSLYDKLKEQITMSVFNSRTGVHYALEPDAAGTAGSAVAGLIKKNSDGVSQIVKIVYRTPKMTSKGKYFITARFRDDEASELYVEDGAFEINAPQVSGWEVLRAGSRPEAYLTHGPQKSDASLFSKLGDYPEPKDDSAGGATKSNNEGYAEGWLDAPPAGQLPANAAPSPFSPPNDKDTGKAKVYAAVQEAFYDSRYDSLFMLKFYFKDQNGEPYLPEPDDAFLDQQGPNGEDQGSETEDE